MTAATHYVCDDCGRTYAMADLITLCRACSGLLEVQYDLSQVHDLVARAAEGRGMWRWRSLLPLPQSAEVVSLGEGDSPFAPMEVLAERIGIRKLYVKNDGLMPTGSFKDRGFSLAVSFARHHGQRRGFTYSSGNAGAAFAAYCARAGMDATVFVEQIANDAKVALITLHAASVYRLEYESSAEIFEAINELARRGHYSYVNFINPIRHEAMKVYAYEICESLGWQAPDVMVHPVGTGGGLWGAWKGFCELRDLGIIDRVPRMVGVQPAVCAPLVDAFEAGREATIRTGDVDATIAQSIAGDDMIHGGRRILRAIRESDGAAVAVSEEAIADAQRVLGAAAIGAEPSAAVSYAALAQGRADGWLHPDDRAVAVVTGSALKQPGTLLDNAPIVAGRVLAQADEMSALLERAAAQ